MLGFVILSLSLSVYMYTHKNMHKDVPKYFLCTVMFGLYGNPFFLKLLDATQPFTKIYKKKYLLSTPGQGPKVKAVKVIHAMLLMTTTK